MKIAKISLLCIFLSCFTTMFADNLYDAIVTQLKSDIVKNMNLDTLSVNLSVLFNLEPLSVNLLVLLNNIIGKGSSSYSIILALQNHITETINTKKPFLLTDDEIKQLTYEQLTEKNVIDIFNKIRLKANLEDLLSSINNINGRINQLIKEKGWYNLTRASSNQLEWFNTYLSTVKKITNYYRPIPYQTFEAILERAEEFQKTGKIPVAH